MGVKLWHDDIRPAPEGWLWARTNAAAMEILDTQDVDEISMDHDLGLENLDPDLDPMALFLAGRSPRGTGEDLVVWMIENGYVPPKITIHSWNPSGARRMANRFGDAGYDVTVAPFVYSN